MNRLLRTVLPTDLAKGLWLTSLLYAIFLALCLMGLRDWKRSLTTVVDDEPLPEAA